MTEKKDKTIHLVRGMKDILPADQPWWDFVRSRGRDLAKSYGYDRIDTPMLEQTNLFIRSVGKGTDIVEKEMFSFIDQGNENVTLRPEATAGIVRAYIEHGLVNQPKPVKLFWLGPLFRHDRPQAGRYRQFWQLDYEALGDDHPAVDAELIMIAYGLLKELGLSPTVQINSIGDEDDRERYKKALVEYFRPRRNQLSEEVKKRLQKNPLRVLDSKEEAVRILVQDAPQIVDYLSETANKHFVKVLEHLDELEIPYVLNPRLVRGLDYYNRTVFELWSQDDEGGQLAFGGGGRYDSLVEQLGGQPTPAAGFAIGFERLIMKMREANVPLPPAHTPNIFVAQLGEASRKKCLKLFEELRRAGVYAAHALSKDGIKQQMEAANRLKVKYTLIFGQKEMLDNTILLRDMDNGIQETIPFEKVVPEVKKRLERSALKENHSSTSPEV
ncbi:MAG: histidine--tRNA ligase [Candidatus Kerfeldbacteria bacterium RIFCSPLOWO2_01_FULL_48_11]|uniref:Histidine--tRNA ligase n=1 Tax=Candidatus Kerfeldbacteria bacterium RIFCSPLOWO2_01_FULL_48_11 TaxID=1798543 RepID=A0A1G2B1H5_9BACT|nr:MAG: Histidine-tRNA ligase [Parcubacteria group bacterium GW2011_GWA2_48_9]KKW14634.1 MAG: Histidine-tRNA ligase [Parcubacteria group bacterium GW2011_GWC2_49_9]OGY83041.1 MAG: histidine--tRNA ligase [Candidatus Kerfeldbacteria bacterium RIFCSPLOWO2_01_FULL_48_11]HCM68232.1 histidine--tRNA ligase [Candidatus Kerfeldbacteria bacterium]